MIYAERIKSLLNDFSKLGAEEELDSKTDEIERLKSQVEMEKRKFQALQKSLGIEGKILIDEVRSEVSSKGARSSCSSFSEDYD